MDPTSGSKPRLRKKELFASLGYTPHEGQVAVHRSGAPRRIVCAGSRWGKTLCAAYEAIAAILEPRERTDGWIVSPSYQLSGRVFTHVVHAMQRGFERRIIEHVERDQILRVVNFGGGVSELRGKSADRPANLLGAGLDFAILDEAATMKAEIWESHVSQRLVDREGWCLMISTPRACPWLRRLFRRGQVGRDPHYASWSAPSWQNPHVSREVIEAERARMSEESFRQEYLGEWTDHGYPPCETCGWPNPMACSVEVFVDGEYELPRCPDCGLYVDENGKSRMGCDKAGTPYFQRIVCGDRPVAAPPVPGSSPNHA